MKAVIARYYKTSKQAERHAKRMRKMWRGRIGWYVVEASNGFFVLSESQARACFPDIEFSYKDRAY